jgi:hypothetical protein
MLGLSALYYPRWETVAASYDNVRAGGGLAPLRVELYEGAIEATTPSAATLASLGVENGGTNGVAAKAALDAGLIAWKNSSYAYNTSQLYFSRFMANSHSKTPSWLVLPGPGTYSLDSTALFGAATPYQLYNGFAGYDSGIQ